MLLYAHGTATDKTFNIADLQNLDNGEGLLIAAVFAAEGYIVVAPNYLGYDTSTLAFHPYLNGDQQSKDMIDALTAARSALPTSGAPSTTDDGSLFVTGLFPGRLRRHGDASRSAGGWSGGDGIGADVRPLRAFRLRRCHVPGPGDRRGSRESDVASVELPELLREHLREPLAEAFEAQYATGIGTLLPSTTSVSGAPGPGSGCRTAEPCSAARRRIPAFAPMTPATAPGEPGARVRDWALARTTC